MLKPLSSSSACVIASLVVARWRTSKIARSGAEIRRKNSPCCIAVNPAGSDDSKRFGLWYSIRTPLARCLNQAGGSPAVH